MLNQSLLKLILEKELTVWNRLVLYTKVLGEDSEIVKSTRTEWVTVSSLLMETGANPLIQGREFSNL